MSSIPTIAAAGDFDGDASQHNVSAFVQSGENLDLDATADSRANIEQFRISQDFSDIGLVQPEYVSIGTRKPKRHEFIRVRPGTEHRLCVATYIDPDSNDEYYLVAPSLISEMQDMWVKTLLVVCVCRNSEVPFLWPLKVPGTNGRQDHWRESAYQAAHLAETSWVRVSSDMSAGRYVCHRPVSALTDPDWSNVPSILELAERAFRGRTIESLDHPLIKQLRGEV